MPTPCDPFFQQYRPEAIIPLHRPLNIRLTFLGGRLTENIAWDKRAFDYLGSAGLLWAINGGRLLELHRDWSVIDVPVHGSQRTFYRRNVDPAKLTLPWTKPTSSSQPAVHGRQGSRKAGRPPRP